MPSGSKPGERRGGRQKGTLNKATADIRALAQVYATEALETLADIIRHGESDAARVAASKELLDRGHGRPAQAMTLDATLRRDPNTITDAELVAIIAADGTDAVH